MRQRWESTLEHSIIWIVLLKIVCTTASQQLSHGEMCKPRKIAQMHHFHQIHVLQHVTPSNPPPGDSPSENAEKPENIAINQAIPTSTYPTSSKLKNYQRKSHETSTNFDPTPRAVRLEGHKDPSFVTNVFDKKLSENQEGSVMHLTNTPRNEISQPISSSSLLNQLASAEGTKNTASIEKSASEQSTHFMKLEESVVKMPTSFQKSSNVIQPCKQCPSAIFRKDQEAHWSEKQNDKCCKHAYVVDNREPRRHNNSRASSRGKRDNDIKELSQRTYLTRTAAPTTLTSGTELYLGFNTTIKNFNDIQRPKVEKAEGESLTSTSYNRNLLQIREPLVLRIGGTLPASERKGLEIPEKANVALLEKSVRSNESLSSGNVTRHRSSVEDNKGNVENPGESALCVRCPPHFHHSNNEFQNSPTNDDGNSSSPRSLTSSPETIQLEKVVKNGDTFQSSFELSQSVPSAVPISSAVGVRTSNRAPKFFTTFHHHQRSPLTSSVEGDAMQPDLGLRDPEIAMEKLTRSMAFHLIGLETNGLLRKSKHLHSKKMSQNADDEMEGENSVENSQQEAAARLAKKSATGESSPRFESHLLERDERNPAGETNLLAKCKTSKDQVHADCIPSFQSRGRIIGTTTSGKSTMFAIASLSSMKGKRVVPVETAGTAQAASVNANETTQDIGASQTNYIVTSRSPSLSMRFRMEDESLTSKLIDMEDASERKFGKDVPTRTDDNNQSRHVQQKFSQRERRSVDATSRITKPLKKVRPDTSTRPLGKRKLVSPESQALLSRDEGESPSSENLEINSDPNFLPEAETVPDSHIRDLGRDEERLGNSVHNFSTQLPHINDRKLNDNAQNVHSIVEEVVGVEGKLNSLKEVEDEALVISRFHQIAFQHAVTPMPQAQGSSSDYLTSKTISSSTNNYGESSSTNKALLRVGETSETYLEKTSPAVDITNSPLSVVSASDSPVNDENVLASSTRIDHALSSDSSDVQTTAMTEKPANDISTQEQTTNSMSLSVPTASETPREYGTSPGETVGEFVVTASLELLPTTARASSRNEEEIIMVGSTTVISSDEVPVTTVPSTVSEVVEISAENIPSPTGEKMMTTEIPVVSSSPPDESERVTLIASTSKSDDKELSVGVTTLSPDIKGNDVPDTANPTTPKPDEAPNDSSIDEAQCDTTLGLQCSEETEKCVCRPGMMYNANEKKCFLLVGSPCEESKSGCPLNAQCKSDMEKAVCQCAQGYTASEDKSQCLAGWNTDCDEEKGSHCHPNFDCLEKSVGKCACKANHSIGLPHSLERNLTAGGAVGVNNNELKCFLDYGTKCDQKDDKCNAVRFLRCSAQSGKCECADSKSQLYDPQSQQCVARAGSMCSLSEEPSKDDVMLLPCIGNSTCFRFGNETSKVAGTCKCLESFDAHWQGYCVMSGNNGAVLRKGRSFGLELCAVCMSSLISYMFTFLL